jgi:hypothetical protein
VTADTPILEGTPVLGRFVCKTEECDETSEQGIYEALPPVWLDYWPTCPCGAALSLEARYFEVRG